jgi:hypothetical protein
MYYFSSISVSASVSLFVYTLYLCLHKYINYSIIDNNLFLPRSPDREVLNYNVLYCIINRIPSLRLYH